MDFDEYQELARPRKTIVDGEMSFWSNGLAGEAAELVTEYKLLLDITIAVGGIANLCKKLDRDDPDHSPEMADIRAGIVLRIQKESGDVQFYLRQVHEKLGLSMSETAEMSIAKLVEMDAAGEKGC